MIDWVNSDRETDDKCDLGTLVGKQQAPYWLLKEVAVILPTRSRRSYLMKSSETLFRTKSKSTSETLKKAERCHYIFLNNFCFLHQSNLVSSITTRQRLRDLLRENGAFLSVNVNRRRRRHCMWQPKKRSHSRKGNESMGRDWPLRKNEALMM